MPGGDRTGPVGLGPMTGRAAGYCAGYTVPGYMNPVRNFISYEVNPIPGRGWGFGFGRGWGRGVGRGFGWQGGFYPRGAFPWYGYPSYAYGYPYYGNPYAYPPEMTAQQEAEMLKEQADAMQEEINSINERIKELESAAKSEKK